MKKRFTLLTAAILCIASLGVGVIATEVVHEIKAELRPDFTVVVDGDVKHFKNASGETVYPVLHEGTTYLPLRAIGELMGKTVFWYEDEKRIELKSSTVTDADVIINDSSSDSPAISSSSDTKEFIGEDRAKEISLQKAGLSANDVKFDRVELDKDNGIWHYEVEFKKGFTEYDADINALDGAIISWEID